MTRQCTVPGCTNLAATRFTTHCAPHRAKFRRHGDVHQNAITKSHIKTYVERVRSRIEKNSDSPAWAALDNRWQDLVGRSQASVALFYRGNAGFRYEQLAAREVIKLSKEVSARNVVEATAAMVMMRELEPRIFRSDRAFWIQLSRRVRALTDLNLGERYVHSTGKVRRYYRELPPKAALILGRWIAESLGLAGLHMARLEKADHEKEAAERRTLHDALSNLS